MEEAERQPDPSGGPDDLAARLIRHCGPELAADARERLAQDPNGQFVGVIMAPDAPEFAQIRAQLEQRDGTDVGRNGVYVVMPREAVLAVLRANAPEMLEWLVDQTPTTMPMLCILRTGFRCGKADM